ncbi:hypothetical protein BDFB_013854 [Asbolus verrucosus]|uniref:Uncharacterized protein n=1 Tax=Asbolus verrucosus TaxID=1661398 RepID=A0A482VZA2_ASBVE|nr:hypothetical protein BDFB_013854 [Asbolus verrucosus]
MFSKQRLWEPSSDCFELRINNNNKSAAGMQLRWKNGDKRPGNWQLHCRLLVKTPRKNAAARRVSLPSGGCLSAVFRFEK